MRIAAGAIVPIIAGLAGGCADLAAQRLEIPGRSCELLASRLPALTEVIDSTAGFAALEAFSSSAMGQVVISLTFGPGGEAGQARVLASDLPDSTAGAVLRALAGVVRDQRDPAVHGTRLLVSVGSPPSVRVEPATFCAPERVPGPDERKQDDVSVIDVRTPNSPGPPRVQAARLRILIGRDGRVEMVQVEQSSGLPDLDRAVEERTRQQRFKPALLDGVPIATWITRP